MILLWKSTTLSGSTRSGHARQAESGANPRGCRISRSRRPCRDRRPAQSRSKRLRGCLEADQSRRNGPADRRRDLCDSPPHQRHDASAACCITQGLCRSPPQTAPARRSRGRGSSRGTRRGWSERSRGACARRWERRDLARRCVHCDSEQLVGDDVERATAFARRRESPVSVIWPPTSRAAVDSA